jgi:hypothetical protein
LAEYERLNGGDGEAAGMAAVKEAASMAAVKEAASMAAVKEAARSLGLCVQVTRSQERTLGVPEVTIASHHLLRQVLGEVSALKHQVASLEAQVNRGGGGVSGSQKRARANKGKGKGIEVAVEVASDSDLSVSEEEEEGGQA